MLAAYRKESAAKLAYGNRGHEPPNAVCPELIAATRERVGFHLSRQTVGRILARADLPSQRKRWPPRHPVRGQRMPSEGMLIQGDGSRHRWLEG